jgi:hypothetical protein
LHRRTGMVVVGPPACVAVTASLRDRVSHSVASPKGGACGRPAAPASPISATLTNFGALACCMSRPAGTSTRSPAYRGESAWQHTSAVAWTAGKRRGFRDPGHDASLTQVNPKVIDDTDFAAVLQSGHSIDARILPRRQQIESAMLDFAGGCANHLICNCNPCVAALLSDSIMDKFCCFANFHHDSAPVG